MSVDAVAAVGLPDSASALQAPEQLWASNPAELTVEDTSAPDSMSFDTLVSSIVGLNDKLVASSDAVHALALGQVDNLHQVMMSAEQTRLAFDLMLQVRGKVLDAYQELLRMQV
jgi:flagellar hook-basal body complex protein FliE